MSTARTAIDIVKETAEAFQVGSRLLLVRLFARDVVLTDVPFNRMICGRQEVLEMLWALRAAFPDLEVRIVDFLPHDREVGIALGVHGRHEGDFAAPFGNLPATHRRLAFPAYAAVTVKAGRVTSIVSYYDAASMLRQLGLTPEAVLDGTRSGSR